MEDLEHHLSGTTTEYLRVRVTYRHSAFPQTQAPARAPATMAMADGIPPLAQEGGVANVQTTLQTTAVATVKRHDFASPWSPHAYTPPQPDELFEIVASH